MRKMKNYVKTGILLIGIALLQLNCQTDSEEIIEQNKIANTPNLKTVSVDAAKEYFETFKLNQPQAKGTNDLIVTPDWNTLKQKELYYSEALLTNVNVSINRTGDFSTELLYIEVEGELKVVIYTLYKDKLDAKGNILDARIFLTEIDGKYIDGYRIENTKIATRFVFQKIEIEDNNNQSKMAKVPTSFWGENNNNYYTGLEPGSAGGGGESDDRIVLNEVLVVGYLKKTYVAPGDPYASNEEFFNPIDELADVANGSQENVDVLGTGISSEEIKDAVTGLVIDPVVKCNEPGFILISGECVVDTESPCDKPGFVRDENGICGPAPDLIIIDPISFENYPCQEIIVTDAYGVCSPLTQLVLDAFESNNKTNLIFKVSSNVSGNGNTFPIALYNSITKTCDVKIQIRESYLTTGTDLSIARTIIHESVHGLFVQMHEEGKFYLPDNTIDPSFNDLASAYTKAMETNNTSGLGLSQHKYMGNLVKDIATSLSAYGEQNGYNLPFSYYNYMAWGGLTHSPDSNGNLVENDFFKNEVTNPNERMTIVNTIVSEQNNDKTLLDGNGNKISPKGKVANASTPCN